MLMLTPPPLSELDVGAPVPPFLLVVVDPPIGTPMLIPPPPPSELDVGFAVLVACLLEEPGVGVEPEWEDERVVVAEFEWELELEPEPEPDAVDVALVDVDVFVGVADDDGEEELLGGGGNSPGIVIGRSRERSDGISSRATCLAVVSWSCRLFRVDLSSDPRPETLAVSKIRPKASNDEMCIIFGIG